MGRALRDVTKVTQSIAIAGKRYRYEAKMPNRCVAAGCLNTARPGIALYKFPKDPVLRKQWVRQMHRTRAKWTATVDGNREVLCSKHFTAECFEESAALASQFGISYKRSRRLVRGAVPTIFLSAAAVVTAEVADESAPSLSSRKRPAVAESSSLKKTAAESPETATNKRSAAEKRERARVWQKLIIKRNKNHSYK